MHEFSVGRRIGICGGGCLLFRGVDPDGGRQPGRLRDFSLEAFRVGQKRDVEGFGTLLQECLGAAVVNGLGCHEADARVAVGGVVPLEEVLAVGARILDAAEPLGEVGTVLERFELGLGVRIVIRDMRPAVGLGDRKTRRARRPRVCGALLAPRSACSVSVPGAM